MTQLIRFLKPTPAWRIPAIIVLGALTGLVIYLFYVSKAHSYLSDDPKTCMNCHIMAPQYATWEHSAHREVATCNDCHVPHNNVVNKYFFKAKDGMRHAYMFTLRKEPQVIRIHEEGSGVVKDNCIRCHGDLLEDEVVANRNTEFNHARLERDCWDCHRETPHGRVNSLSSVPYSRVPVPSSIVPSWLEE